MQSLWSRAGQAHRCGCRACETAISSLGRRASTAAQRRKPTFTEIFTACYSSVFATATIIDAIRKEDRRQELDRQLDDARRELNEIRDLVVEETTGLAASLLDDKIQKLSFDQMGEIWDALKEVDRTRPPLKQIYKRSIGRSSTLRRRLMLEHYNAADWETILERRRAITEDDYERLERAIVAEEVDASLPNRLPKTQKQLDYDTAEIRRVVGLLLDYAGRSSEKSPSFDQAREMLEKRDFHYSLASRNPARANSVTRLLNQRLRNIIASEDLGHKEIVGRVCYNLLVSPYPPDMHTYNTLVVAFNKTKHPMASDPFVTSFFYRRRLLPTPATFDIILNHYRRTNNAQKFLRIIQCITGIDVETGAKICRRHVDDIKMLRVTPEWREPGRWKTRTGNFVYAHAPLSQSMIETIIKGLLQFSMFDQAAMVFVACIQANINVGTDLVKYMLDTFITSMDWRAAVRLVRGLTDLPSGWPALLLQGDVSGVSYVVDRLNVILDLCGLRTQGVRATESALTNLGISKARFDGFLDALDSVGSYLESNSVNSIGPVRGPPGDQALAVSKSRFLQIESLWRESALMDTWINAIQSELFNSGFDWDFRAAMARFQGQEATERSIRLIAECMEVGGNPQLEESRAFSTEARLWLNKNPNLGAAVFKPEDQTASRKTAKNQTRQSWTQSPMPDDGVFLEHLSADTKLYLRPRLPGFAIAETWTPGMNYFKNNPVLPRERLLFEKQQKMMAHLQERRRKMGEESRVVATV